MRQLVILVAVFLALSLTTPAFPSLAQETPLTVTATFDAEGYPYTLGSLDGGTPYLTTGFSGQAAAVDGTFKEEGGCSSGGYFARLTVELEVDPEWLIHSFSTRASATSTGSSCGTRVYVRYMAGGSWSALIQLGNPGTLPTWTFHQYPASSSLNLTGIEAVEFQIHRNNVGSSTALADDVSINYFEVAPIVASFTADPPSGAGPLEVDFTDTSVGEGIDTWLWDFDNGNTAAVQNPTETFIEAGNYNVCLTVTGDGGQDAHCEIISVTGVGTPGGALYRPLADIDFDPDFESLYGSHPLLNFDITDRVYAHSTISGKNVYAVADGTVESVTPLGPCTDAGASNASIGGITTECLLVTSQPSDGAIAIGTIQRAGLYHVVVSFDTDRSIHYVVAEAPNFVRAGMKIKAGCIIGKTFHFGFPTPLINDLVAAFLEGEEGEPTPTDGTNGITVLWLFDEADQERDPLINQLTVSVIPSLACNVDPEFARCLGDPQFTRRTDWTSTGQVLWSDGVTLRPNASISMTMNLSGLVAYSFTVQIERIGTSTGEVTLRVGQSTDSFLLQYQVDDYTLGPSTHVADIGGFYTISITNTGTFDFKVLNNCLTDGSPNTTPDLCYFSNYSFDQGLDDWMTEGNVFLGAANGEIAVEHLGVVGQNLLLYPEGISSFEYHIIVRATIYGANDPDPWLDATSTVEFEWDFQNTDTWTTMDSLLGGTEATFADFYRDSVYNITYSANEVTFQANVTASDVEEGIFEIRPVIDDSGQTDFQGGVFVREVCMTNGFGNYPIGGGPALPFREQCDFVSPPQGNDVGAWTFWLFRSLDHFFQCDLMVLLNSLYKTILELFEFVQWQMLYWQTYVITFNHWLGQSLLPWLAGHFDNIALGRSTTIIESNGTCNNIFCLLEALINHVINPIIGILENFINTILGWLNAAVNLLLDVLTAIFSILITFVTALLNLFNTFTGFLAAIVNGWNNAEPTPIPGLPTCAIDPRSNAMCITMWGAEHTLFSGPGALIIPLIIGFASIHLLLWAVKTFKDQLEKAAANA